MPTYVLTQIDPVPKIVPPIFFNRNARTFMQDRLTILVFLRSTFKKVRILSPTIPSIFHRRLLCVGHMKIINIVIYVVTFKPNLFFLL